VNVNAIAPGFFATDFTQALQDDPERSAALMGRVPAKRWGKAEDIGGAAVYLASAASDFVHGATLTVDGGWLAN
jgi:2-deoxy-D-gluconate 3-dehydrogenase